jgi:hypothetical protein
MKLALIDADILPYEIGSVFDETISTRKVLEVVDRRIESILEETGCDDYTCFITNSGNNFRLQRATVAPYKGHRSPHKPYHWVTIRDHLKYAYEAIEADGCEADDLIADMKKQYDNSIICSRDKDFDTIPGWHYRWKCGERQPQRTYYVNRAEAWQFFYFQLLAGDTADNIKGIVGVGNVGAKTALAGCTTKDALHEAARHKYIEVYGGGSNDLIFYEDEFKNKHWRTPIEIMAEMADLLYLGTDRSYLERFYEE